jgi:hypothetical protein
MRQLLEVPCCNQNNENSTRAVIPAKAGIQCLCGPPFVIPA